MIYIHIYIFTIYLHTHKRICDHSCQISQDNQKIHPEKGPQPCNWDLPNTFSLVPPTAAQPHQPGRDWKPVKALPVLELLDGLTGFLCSKGNTEDDAQGLTRRPFYGRHIYSVPHLQPVLSSHLWFKLIAMALSQ